MPGGRLGVAWRLPGGRLGADKSTCQPSAPVLPPGHPHHRGAEATHRGAEAKSLIFLAGGGDLFVFKRPGMLASAPGWVAASDLYIKRGQGRGSRSSAVEEGATQVPQVEVVFCAECYGAPPWQHRRPGVAWLGAATGRGRFSKPSRPASQPAKQSASQPGLQTSSHRRLPRA